MNLTYCTIITHYIAQCCSEELSLRYASSVSSAVNLTYCTIITHYIAQCCSEELSLRYASSVQSTVICQENVHFISHVL